jgi:hypothetical protein
MVIEVWVKLGKAGGTPPLEMCHMRAPGVAGSYEVFRLAWHAP